MTTRVTTYQPLPIAFTHGQGVWLYDEAGTPYLDTFSGIAVCGLGHAHPEVTQTIQQQAAKLLHVSNAFHIRSQEQLAERLTQLTGMAQLFFCNSGAEANETALKLARLHGHKKGIEAPAVIVMQGAFHGRTLATLSASGNRKVQAGFEPLVPGFIRAPYNDIEALRRIADHTPEVAAVLVEPIQGEGGVIVGDEIYLKQCAELCREKGWLFMVDEVQTGNGRTGHWFVSQGLGLRPDVLTTAKGLGNGIPIGVCLMDGLAIDLFTPGTHGSTFGGNPLACATAFTVIEVIEKEGLCQQALTHGQYLKTALLSALGDLSAVVQVRGKGLMIGIELDRPCLGLRLKALEHQLLLNVTAERVIRLVPPLIITMDEMDQLVDRLKCAIHEFI